MAKGVELPPAVLGRKIRPFSLALFISTTVVVYQYEILEQGPGNQGLDVFETVFATTAVVCLFFGWLLRNDDLHEWGLVLAAGVWSMRMSLYFLEQGPGAMGAWLSMAWVIAAVGAWALEAYDHRWRVHIQKAGEGGV